MEMHLHISLILFFIAIILGFVVISSQLSTIRKMIIVTSLAFAGILTYKALNAVYGYPTLLEKGFDDIVVLSFLVSKEEDSVYLWLRDKTGGIPRSYKVPYNRDLAKSLRGMRSKHKGKGFRARIGKKGKVRKSSGKEEDKYDLTELRVLPPKYDNPH